LTGFSKFLLTALSRASAEGVVELSITFDAAAIHTNKLQYRKKKSKFFGNFWDFFLFPAFFMLRKEWK
jgi:hypothetical protein